MQFQRTGLDYESGGQEFESLRARQSFQRLNRYSGESRFPEIAFGKHMGNIRRDGGLEMPDSEFKIVTGGGDWGSPLASEGTFESLEDAQAAAREYLTSQRQAGGSGVPLRVSIEETRPDGSVVKHSVG
jgi:hypothetical protein